MRGRKPKQFELKPRAKVYLHMSLRNGHAPLWFAVL
jgi:hypothetical protein